MVVKIDGSFGEGGGQIVRTAVSLSSLTQRPVQIENIRKKRKKPGLKAQHLTAIKLLSKICNASVSGLEIGSTKLEFYPREIQSCNINENVGTAGSIPLIIQVLIVPVALSNKKLSLSIIGGTDVPWSPTSNYTKHVLGAAYSRMGINFSMDIRKRGYYPKGGGEVSLEIYPSKTTFPILLTRQTTKIVNLFCSYSKLPSENISSNVEKIKDELQKNGKKINAFVTKENAHDFGGSILIYSQDPNSIVGIDGLIDKNCNFPRNISRRFLECKLGVDVNLSDMLVVPASVIKETSLYRIPEITTHLQTNLYVASKVTGCKYGIGKLEEGYELRIKGLESCI